MSKPTAAQVRAYFRTNEARMSALSPEARKPVEVGARGLIHPAAVKAFNVKRRKNARYEVGASKAEVAAKRATREALRAQGIHVGKAGRLSREASKAARALAKSS